MDATSVKEKILKAVREALIEKDEDILPESEANENTGQKSWPEVLFAEKFIAKGGNFLFCEKSKDLLDGVTELFKKNDLASVLCLNEDLAEVLESCEVKHLTTLQKDQPIDYVVTQVDALVASSGSVIVSFNEEFEHIVTHSGAALVLFARTNQVVKTFADVSKQLKNQYQDQRVAYTHIIDVPTTKDKFEFPRKTYVFLRYVK